MNEDGLVSCKQPSGIVLDRLITREIIFLSPSECAVEMDDAIFSYGKVGRLYCIYAHRDYISACFDGSVSCSVFGDGMMRWGLPLPGEHWTL